MRAICRYFGSALYPAGAAAAARVDALVDQVKDMDVGRAVASYKARFGVPASVLHDGNAELVFAAWRGEALPRHLAFFDAALGASPTAWVAATPGPSIADVFLATQLASYRAKFAQLAPYPPRVQALVDRVYALPEIVAFCAAEAKTK